MGKPAHPRALSESQACAIGRNIRVSPRKLNLVAQAIRGKTAGAALSTLTFSEKRIARDVKKILESAIANAENNHDLDVDDLVVSEASVGKNLTMKRFHPRARGRAGKVEKPFAQITIVVSEKSKIVKKVKAAPVAEDGAEAPVAKAPKKTAAKKTTSKAGANKSSKSQGKKTPGKTEVK
jgi:large subunit ribosomal protein L22